MWNESEAILFGGIVGSVHYFGTRFPWQMEMASIYVTTAAVSKRFSWIGICLLNHSHWRRPQPAGNEDLKLLIT